MRLLLFIAASFSTTLLFGQQCADNGRVLEIAGDDIPLPEFWHPGKGLVFRSFCTDTDTNEIRTGKVNFWDCSIGSIQNAEVTYGVCDDVLEVLLIKVKKGDVDLMLDTLVSLYGQPNFVEDRFFEWYLDEDTVLLRFKFTGGIINRYGRAEAAWMRKESSSVQD